MTILFLIVVNSVMLETFYYHNKKNSSLEVFELIKEKLEIENVENFSNELEKIALNNNFDIEILDDENQLLYTTDNNFVQNFGDIKEINYDINYSIFNKSEIMYSKDGVTIRKIQDKTNGINFILLEGKIENTGTVYIRMPVNTIKESTSISNESLWVIALVSVGVSGIAFMVISDKFTKPIEELNDIANRMTKLDFSKKYRIQDNEDEINELGKSINKLSDTLETTINKLKKNNMELEKDIESKSKIDEMRKQFISDVSHELKTPIALIQGYAEGLVENVNSDEESKNFYAGVILDEANKMDVLVKRLLELMKLEYEDREFNNKNFDLCELINEVIRTSAVMLKENNIEVEFKQSEPVVVFADDFYIEQVVNNYFTNAIKNIKEINGKKKIKINIKNAKDDKKYKVTVFNTGSNIDEENIPRIWNRFYKLDESRDRSKGGHGIGLSLVKAIMNKYNCSYGVKNKQDGVEFFFEIEKERK
jgi:signal transduction histidine kinase